MCVIIINQMAQSGSAHPVLGRVLVSPGRASCRKHGAGAGGDLDTGHCHSSGTRPSSVSLRVREVGQGR